MWNWSENQITLVLIRHGTTKSNKEHRYLGRTEESLSKEGICELLKFKQTNRYPEVAYLFSSPMKRCLETAQMLYPDCRLVVIPEWEEMDFGAFEGKNYIELRDDERYQAWIDSNGMLPFPEGESREEFVLRCEKGLHRMLELLSQLSEKNENVICTVGLVVHGGTIMSLLSRYNGGEYFDFHVPNGGGYICTLKGNGPEPEIVNIEML